jgi:predicted patatin/cPLA2 family phospholipase
MHSSTISPADENASLAPGTVGAHLRELAREPLGARRLALVVQGGGLRGIYSLSALAVLEELGLRNAFSRVIGSSAGAINAAYFLAGQATESLSIYYDDLCNRDFFNPWRLRKRVDIDYMIAMLKRKHTLDVEAMLAAPATLYTVLTDAETAEGKVLSNRDPDFEPYQVFHATAALPWLYGKHVQIGERHYIDGGLAGLVPLNEALAKEPPAPFPGEDTVPPSEALVVLTRQVGHRKRPPNAAIRACARLAPLGGPSDAIRDKVCAGDKRYDEVMARLEREETEAMYGQRQTWTVRPSNLRRLVGRTTTDSTKLRECAAMAQNDTLALLAQPHPGAASTGRRDSVRDSRPPALTPDGAPAGDAQKPQPQPA